MKVRIAALALGSVLVASGASALPLAPGTHVTGELQQLGAAIERVHERSAREVSRDRYRRVNPNGYYRYGLGANQRYQGGVGVYRQPPASNYTRRNFPYAFGDTYGYWPDHEPN